MPRIDVWDAAPQQEQPVTFSLGYPEGLAQKYRFGKELGQGGFGSVRVVEEIATGTQWACKSIKKRLEVPNVTPAAQARHLDNVKREVAILRRLRGTLNVVHLEDVFEDAESVHLVMEYCKGGELLHSLGKRPYSEGTVADYMRAVLRTLAQCHHFRILHRDIKPGNFMLLNEAPDAPLKAIDFGLAVFFDPKKLPLTDLGFEGTPWFMAPEALSSKVGPPSDIWAAGVMAYQLLSGAFPFNDWSNTRNPALSKVWRSILTDEPKLSGSCWDDISDNAKDFLRKILDKDPATRPTAKQALKHPWLADNVPTSQRGGGAPLSAQVVQRLQRYGLSNALKRTILDMITNELLHKHATAAIAAGSALGRLQGHGSLSNVAAAGGAARPASGSGTPAATADAGGGAGASPEGMQGDAGSAGFSGLAAPGEAPAFAGHSPFVGGSMRGSSTRLSSVQRRQLALELLRSAGPANASPTTGGKAMTVHAGADAYALLSRAAARGSAGGAWERGSGAFVPPPPSGRFGSQAWWAAQAGTSPAPIPQGQEAGQAPIPMETDDSRHAAAAGVPGGGGPSGHSGSSFSGAPDLSGEWGSLRSRRYAFLVGLQEQTFNGISKQGGLRRVVTHIDGADAHVGSPSTPGMSKRNGSDMLRLLGSVQRQRLEHRKMQRLSLDTSGRGLAGYADIVGAPIETMEEGKEGDEAEEDDDTTSELKGDGEEEEERQTAGRSVADGEEEEERKSMEASASLAATVAMMEPATSGDVDMMDERGGRRKHAFKAFLEESATQEAAAAAAAAAAGAGGGSAEAGEGGGEAQESGRRGRNGYAALGLLAPPEAGSPSQGTGPGVTGYDGSSGGGAAGPPLPTGAGASPPPAAGMMSIRVVPKVHNTAAVPLQPQPLIEPAVLPGLGHAQQAPSTSSAQPSGLLAGQLAAAGLIKPLSGHPGAAVPSPGHGSVSSGPDAGGQARVIPSSSDEPRSGSRPWGLAAATAAPGEAERMGSDAMLAALAELMPSQEQLQELLKVLDRMRYEAGAGGRQELSFEQISEGLQKLGYRLDPSEVELLLREVAGTGGGLSQSQFIASQVDWRAFQANHRDEWLDCLRKTFEAIDVDRDGNVQVKELVDLLSSKLPESEVNLAVQEMLMDTAIGPDGLDFDDFAALVGEESIDGFSQNSSVHGLDLFDARLALDAVHEHFSPELDPVPDDGDCEVDS